MIRDTAHVVPAIFMGSVVCVYGKVSDRPKKGRIGLRRWLAGR
eukprot:COSAG01_NODE_3916_length_5541_cov_12.214994_2_plen_43_part_00